MFNGYMHTVELTDIKDESAKIKDFKYFLHEGLPLDKLLKEKFPLSYFGKPDEVLRIKGSSQLLSSFESIDEEKFDISTVLGNLEYIGLTSDNQIIINFKEDQITANGIYHFSYDFFEELFSMGKFSDFCIKNEYTDILRENVENLIKKRSTVGKQYRIIKKENQCFLRGVTSPTYQNYDNNIVIYLSLLNLHRAAKKHNVFYKIAYACLTDSFVRIIIEQEDVYDIKHVGKLNFGVVITNNEIREGAFSIELRYKLTNENGKSFSGMPPLKNSVFKINHRAGIEKIDTGIARLEGLQTIQESMIDLIKGLKDMKEITHDAMYSLYRKIVYSKNFHSKTKKNFKELYEQDDIENVKNIIDAFDKVNSITTDMDEHIFLERIYHELINDIVNRRV